MRILMHDRYVVTAPSRAWDLATGGELPFEAVTPAAAVRSSPALEPLLDTLDHGREGEPQCWTLMARDRMECRTLADAVADGAQRRGYVPVGLGQYRQDVVREAHALFGAAAARELPGEHPEVTRLMSRAARAPEFVRCGRHAAAERVLREVGAALERRRVYGNAASVSLHLGQILFERGRAGQADVCGSEAARLADLAHNSALACEARLLQAWARLDLARLADAEAIARAVMICSPGEAVGECARATLARCLLEQGRLRELHGIDLVPGEGLVVNVRWRAIIHDVVTAVLIESGRLFEAGRRTRAVLDAWPDEADLVASAVLHTAHLRVVSATGDLKLAEGVLQCALDAARRARAPLRALRARAVWLAGLARAGAADAVGPVHVRVRRLLRVAPPMLVREVEAALRPRAAGQREATTAGETSMAATLLALAQDDDDEQAIRGVLTFALKELDASRIDVVSGDAGPASTLTAAGAGPGASLGSRVLEVGTAIGFETETETEAGVPVRLGPRQVAALVARWTSGRALPANRRAILECAAAVVAARVDGIQQRAREASAASVEIPELIGVGLATSELRKAVIRAARAPFSVLIEGESGVGKELVARAIHQLSPRRERRFCDVNCAALPDELFETELFGHAKGAFTGAVADRAGLFEEASGGTLFLDEVADLSARAQAKLLRAVQQQEVRRIGESFVRPVDVRFVAAANRGMAGEVEAGRFRADLLYRLDVIHIRIAPLRERPEDIPVIARHLWRQAAARVGSSAVLTPAVFAALAHYPWPGNVRELQNVIAGLAVAAPPRGRVRAALLPPVINASSGMIPGSLAPARDRFERRFIELALARAGGNRTRAARALGLSRQGLLKSITRLGIQLGGSRTVE